MFVIFALVGSIICPKSSIAVPSDCATTSDPLRLIAFRHVSDQKKVTELAHPGSCVTLEAQCAQLIYCLTKPSNYSCAPISPYKTTYICHQLRNCHVLVCNGYSETKKQITLRVLSRSDDNGSIRVLDVRTNVRTLTKLFRTDLFSWAVFCYVTLIVSTVVVFFIALALLFIYCTSYGNRFRRQLHENVPVPEQSSVPRLEELCRAQSATNQVSEDGSELWSAPPTNQPKPPSYHSVVIQTPTSGNDGK